MNTQFLNGHFEDRVLLVDLLHEEVRLTGIVKMADSAGIYIRETGKDCDPKWLTFIPYSNIRVVYILDKESIE